MPSEETNELISAKEAADMASKTSVDSFMADVNRAIRYASKHGEYSVDLDNYGTGHTLIKTKLLADSIEVLLKSAGYHTNVVFSDEFGCYRFYIDWTPEETALPVFPTDEEWEEARKRFSVAQDDARKIHPVGQQRDPFEGYDRERFVRELKDANMLLSGWLDEETKLRNQIERLEFNQDWHKIGLYKKDDVVAKLNDGNLVIGKLVDNGKFLVEKVIVDNITCHHMVQNIEIDDIAMWKHANLPPEK
jgi:hypothetical protein